MKEKENVERTIKLNEKFIYILSHIMLIIGVIIPYKGVEINELSWVVLGPFMIYISLLEIFRHKNSIAKSKTKGVQK